MNETTYVKYTVLLNNVATAVVVTVVYLCMQYSELVWIHSRHVSLIELVKFPLVFCSLAVT